MPLLQLIGRLGLDTSEYEANLKKSELSAAAFGKKFSSSIVSTVGKFFTIGYAVEFVAGKIRALEESNNALDESFLPVPGTLTDDIRASQQRVEGLTSELKAKQDLHKLDNELLKTADARFLAELSAEDKRTELTRRRIALLQVLKTASMEPSKRAEMTLAAEKLLTEITGIKVDAKESEQPEFRRVNIPEKAFDPLARIGGFTGGADVKVVSELQQINRNTAATAENTAGSSVAFR